MRLKKVGIFYPEDRKDKGKIADVFETAGYIVEIPIEKYDSINIFEKIS